MKIFKTLGLLALCTSMLFITSCEKEDDNGEPNPTVQKGTFTLKLDHLFDGNAFALNQAYTNGSGESLEFTKVRYYLTNIKLEKMDGTVWAEPESYHLVDADDMTSTHIQLADIPEGEYHKISYMVGVDSTRNVSGAQQGALSPANDMFWSWNSGYIFFKLEGNSPQAPDGDFRYHVGGFAGANNAIALHNHSMHDQMLKINPNASPQVHIEVDIKKAFDGMHTISVAAMPKVHMPGMMAVHLSHNFHGAFVLDHVHD